MKKLIRLTESDLHKIIKESVKRIITESNVSDHDYNTLPLKDGGWDSYAFDYDKALDDAESIEDWDERMRIRDSHAKTMGDMYAIRHPQSTTLKSRSVGAGIYTNPEEFGVEDPLKELDKEANSGRKYGGFPI